jgi:hypothetical protein
VNIFFPFLVKSIAAVNNWTSFISEQVLGTDDLNAYLNKYRIVLDPQLEALIGRYSVSCSTLNILFLSSYGVTLELILHQELRVLLLHMHLCC